MSKISKMRKISQYLSNSKKKQLLIISSLMLFFIFIPILIPHNGPTNIVATNSNNTENLTHTLNAESSNLPPVESNDTLYIEVAQINNITESASLNLSVLLFYTNNSNYVPCNDLYNVSWSISNGTVNPIESGNLTCQFGNLFETQINTANNPYLYPGNYYIIFNATGNNLQNTSIPYNFTVYPKSDSALKILNIPNSLTFGQKISLTYQLFSPNSSFTGDINGLPIIITTSFGQTFTLYMDGNGKTTFPYQLPATGMNSLTITATFPGTKTIYPCSNSTSFRVLNKVDTNLTFQTFESGNLLTGVYYYSVNLTDAQGNPLSNMNVTYEVLNPFGYIVETGTSLTDASGTSSISLNLNVAGTYSIEVIYTGQGIYYPAKSLNVTVQVMTPLSMVIQRIPEVAIIIGIIVVGIIVYQRAYLVPKRKRRLESLKSMHQKFTDAENIQYILILTRDGLAIFSRSFTNIPIDGNLISGFLSAISSFGTQLGAQMKNKKASIIDKGLEQLSYQQFKIIVNDATLVRTAVLLRRDASETLKDNIKRFNYTFQETYLEKLQNYDGEVLDELPILDLIEKYLELDLLYPHNINLDKIKDYTYGLSVKSIKRRILRQAVRPPFHNTFYIRDMIDYFVEKDLSESAVFNEIIDLREDGVIFAVNPIIQSLMEQFETIIDKLSPEAKNVIKTLKEGKFSIQGIKNVDSALKELQDLRLVDSKNELTDAGEDLGSLLRII